MINLITVKQEDVFALFEADGIRSKILTLPVRALLSFIYGQLKNSHSVMIPEMDLPNGCKILSARMSEFNGCIEVCVYHPSFDLVPECKDPPKMDALIKWNIVELMQPLDKELRDRQFDLVRILREKAENAPHYEECEWLELLNSLV